MDSILPLLGILVTTQCYVDEVAWLPPHPYCKVNYTIADDYVAFLERSQAGAIGWRKLAIVGMTWEARDRRASWYLMSVATKPGGRFGLYYARSVRASIGDEAWMRQQWPSPVPLHHLYSEK